MALLAFAELLFADSPAARQAASRFLQEELPRDNVDVDVMPTDLAVFSGSYSFERYEALSRSRQASNNPAEFDNPARNWATEGLV